MCDPFLISFSGSAQELIAKATAQLGVQGGTLDGNAFSGKLNITLPIIGLIAGSYAISGQVVTITITDKPALLPCNLIESKLREILTR